MESGIIVAYSNQMGSVLGTVSKLKCVNSLSKIIITLCMYMLCFPIGYCSTAECRAFEGLFISFAVLLSISIVAILILMYRNYRNRPNDHHHGCFG